jgi:putative two-component system response regulator
MRNSAATSSADILIVDDTLANLTLLGGMLKEKGYKVRPVPSGTLALAAVQHKPPDLILLDITMPQMDGYEVCRRLKADVRFQDIPIVFISALSETIDKVKAFGCGGLDYVTKPFQFEEVEARVETHLKLRQYQVRLEQLVDEKVQEIGDAQLSTILALSKLSESRDTDTGKHIERVQSYCRLIAEYLPKWIPQYETIVDAEFIRNIHRASPLHDIGKVAIPDSVLLKPGKLEPDEFELMKTHTLLGADTLAAVRTAYPNNALINMGVSIARSHHERWDGGGYPDRLAGPEIPLAARIMAIADVYDALQSKRCYKEAFSHDECFKLIMAGSGTQFDPECVAVFMAIKPELEKFRTEEGGGGKATEAR